MKTIYRYTLGPRLFASLLESLKTAKDPNVVEVTVIDGVPSEVALDRIPMTLRSASHTDLPPEKKHGLECQVFSYGICNC